MIPLLFTHMAEILDKIVAMAEPLLEGTDMFIVNIWIKPINNIRLYVDADAGLTVEKSARLNRKLSKLIEEAGMFPEGDFSLEVSSPGVDEPLMQLRQYRKNLERTVLVTPNEGADVLGVLKAVDEEKLTLEVTPNPKKKDTQMVEMPMDTIKKTVVQIVF